MIALSATVCRRAATMAGACAGLLVSVYLLAVWTRAGQRFEDRVLRAATLTVGGTAETHATAGLDRINSLNVAGAVLAVMAIPLVRHKVLVGFVSAAVIGASVLTVQAMRQLALRPALLPYGDRRDDQSFPSGHVAVALAVMSAHVLVTPYRFRGAVLLIGSLWATGINIATITPSWHRPSDTSGPRGGDAGRRRVVPPARPRRLRLPRARGRVVPSPCPAPSLSPWHCWHYCGGSTSPRPVESTIEKGAVAR